MLCCDFVLFFFCFKARPVTVEVLEVILLCADASADDEGVRAGEVGHGAGVEGVLGHQGRGVVARVEGDKPPAGELGLDRAAVAVVPALGVEGGGAADEEAGAALQRGEHADVVLAVGLRKKRKRERCNMYYVQLWQNVFLGNFFSLSCKTSCHIQ